jgi:hypothetical protein
MLEEPIKEGDAGPPKMKGSAMLCGAKTKEEVMERLKRDVYVSGEVWVSDFSVHVCMDVTDSVLGSRKGADYPVQECHKEGVVVSLTMRRNGRVGDLHVYRTKREDAMVLRRMCIIILK